MASGLGVMTMSIHKLSAGSGYDYLTRQVAALDATAKGHVGLASYYTERGESPGVWVGSGLAGVDGLNAGDAVTAEQMRAMYGAGMHPLATQRLEQLRDADLTDANIEAATRLGVPFKISVSEPGRFRVEVAKRIAASNKQAGLPTDWPVSSTERAKIRTEVAQELFAAEHGRPPADARELAGTIAKHSRPAAQTVAGYDLTFSPVKSVSTLWAVAGPQVAAQIERAHHAAVGDALRFLEQHALYTREGPQGIRQVNVRGLVAAAFTHRDSRAGDPDLHTHVAVANKVQTLAGGGCRSMAGCCSKRRWLPRKPTTPPWSIISATAWVCASGPARHRPAETAGAGDRRRGPGPEPALVYPATVDQGPAR